MPYIKVENLVKTYKTGTVDLTALDNVSLEVNKGELVVIVGESGAGKTTLLNMLGGMDVATSGKMTIDGQEITSFSERKLTLYRRNDIGFIFQFYNLVQNLNTLENVELATQICKKTLNPKEVLIDVGLKDRIKNYPSQLSGGEQQRVAIARAVAKNPKLLLCDEPTGALDYKTGKEVLKLLQNMARQKNMTVIIITHDEKIALEADRVITIDDGKIVKDEMNE